MQSLILLNVFVYNTKPENDKIFYSSMTFWLSKYPDSVLLRVDFNITLKKTLAQQQQQQQQHNILVIWEWKYLWINLM